MPNEWNVWRWLGLERPQRGAGEPGGRGAGEPGGRGAGEPGGRGAGKPGEVERGILDPVVDLLEHLEPERARYVAGLAYLLGRVASVDSDISATEGTVMKQLVQEEAGLSEQEADAVVRLALDEGRRAGWTHNLLVTRDLAGATTLEQRLAILRCLFAVSAADESVQMVEDNEIRRISRELRIEHGDFIRARMDVREHLAVLRGKRSKET